MPPSAPLKVTPDMSRDGVQRIMNNAQGEVYWVGSNTRWRNLLTARNNFTREYLHGQEITTKQYKMLRKEEQRLYEEPIEEAFTNGFYLYTRNDYWMKNAVGEHGSWIAIDGMAHWHIRQALISLKSTSNSSATPPFSSGQLSPESGASSSQAPHFDPVRDSARDNIVNQ